MPEKLLQIKDSQVKKNLRWHILRLLRLNSRARQELIYESRKLKQGEDPKLEKFSRFIKIIFTKDK